MPAENLVSTIDKPLTVSDVDLVGKYHQKRVPGELLRGLGIFGWQAIEDLFLSAICREEGSNVTLLGSAGSGKTNAALRVGAALYGSLGVRKVDTPIEDENTLGVCDIPDLAAGKMSSFKTDYSILNFSLIILDEANRTTPTQQRIWLPVLENRVVLHHKMKAKSIILTMNPLTGDYAGVEPMDKATAERISKIITVPEYHEMTSEDRLAILKMKSARSQSGVIKPDSSNNLKAAVLATQKKYPEIRDYYLDEIVKYVDDILIASNKKGLDLQSSRTGQHIVDDFLWLQTWRHIVYGSPIIEGAVEAALRTFQHAVVAEVYTDPIEDIHIKALHAGAKHHLLKGDGEKISMFQKIEHPFLKVAYITGESALELNPIQKVELTINAFNLFFSSKEADIKKEPRTLLQRAILSLKLFPSSISLPDSCVLQMSSVIDSVEKILNNNSKTRLSQTLRNRIQQKAFELTTTLDTLTSPSIPILPYQFIQNSGVVEASQTTLGSFLDFSKLLEDNLTRLLVLCVYFESVLIPITLTPEQIIDTVRKELEIWETYQGPNASSAYLKGIKI